MIDIEKIRNTPPSAKSVITLKRIWDKQKDKKDDEYIMSWPSYGIALTRRRMIDSRPCVNEFYKYTTYVTQKGIDYLKQIGYITE